MSRAGSVTTSKPGINPLPFYVGAFCVLWSASFVAGKVGVTDCPPLILLTARFLGAGGLILGVLALRGRPWDLSRRDVIAFAILGIANNALYLGFGYVGMLTVSAGLNALIVSANPVFTAILAATFLGERMTARKVAGLLLGMAGVAMIVAHRITAGTDAVVGIVFSVGSLAAMVAGTLLFRVLAPKGDLWLGNGVQNISGGLALVPFAWAFSDVGDIVPSARLFWAFGYLVLFGSIIAFVLWFHMLNVFGATAASAYHFLMPPLGMFFGWLILGEHLTGWDLIGIVPVALGIALVTRPAKRVATQPAPAPRA